MLQCDPVSSTLMEISMSGTLFTFKQHPLGIMSIGNDHDLTIWDIDTLKCNKRIEGKQYPITDALFVNNNYIIAYVDGMISTYDADGNLNVSVKLQDIPLSLAYHDNIIYVGTTCLTVYLLDHNTLKQVSTLAAQSWVTQIAYYDKLYIMDSQVYFDGIPHNIGHKAQIMSHHKFNDLIATGDSEGLVILSTFPQFNKLAHYKMNSAIVQLQITDNTIIIGTLDPGIDIIDHSGKLLHTIPNRAAPLLLLDNKLFARSTKLTRVAYSTVEKVTLSIAFPCQVQVNWKRGKQKLESTIADLIANQAIFNQTLEMESNLYFEAEHFLEKKAAFTILLITSKGNKVAGQANIDISTYLNKKQESVHEIFKLDKCPDKHAKLLVQLTFKFVQEVDIDTLSRMSMRLNDSFESQAPVSSIAADTTELSILDKELDNCKSQLQNALLKVQQKESIISQLTTESTAKSDQYNDLAQELQQLKTKFYETLDKLQHTEEQNEQLTQQRDALLQRLKQKDAQEYQNKALIKELQDQQTQSNGVIKQLENKIQQQQKQFEMLKEHLNDSEQSGQIRIQSDQQGYMDTINKLEKRVTQLQDQLKRFNEKQESDYALIILKEKNLQNQLIDKNEEINKLTRQQSKQSDDKINADLLKQIEAQQAKEDQFNKILTQYKDQLQKSLMNERQLKVSSQQSIDQLQEQVINLKFQIGNLFNAAQDHGGSKLVDKLQYAVGIKE